MDHQVADGARLHPRELAVHVPAPRRQPARHGAALVPQDGAHRQRHLRARAETPAAPVSSSAATSGYAFGSRTLSSTAASSGCTSRRSRARRAETRTVSSPAESARCSPKAGRTPPPPRVEASNSAEEKRRDRRRGVRRERPGDGRVLQVREPRAGQRGQRGETRAAAPSASRSRPRGGGARSKRTRGDETNAVASSPLRRKTETTAERVGGGGGGGGAPPPAPFSLASRAARAASRHTRGNASMETEPTEPLTLFVLSAGLEALEEPEAVGSDARAKRMISETASAPRAKSASRSRAAEDVASAVSVSHRSRCFRNNAQHSRVETSSSETSRFGNWRDASSANAPYGNLPSDFLHLRREGVSRRAARAARRGRPVARARARVLRRLPSSSSSASASASSAALWTSSTSATAQSNPTTAGFTSAGDDSSATTRGAKRKD